MPITLPSTAAPEADYERNAQSELACWARDGVHFASEAEYGYAMRWATFYVPACWIYAGGERVWAEDPDLYESEWMNKVLGLVRAEPWYHDPPEEWGDEWEAKPTGYYGDDIANEEAERRIAMVQRWVVDAETLISFCSKEERAAARAAWATCCKETPTLAAANRAWEAAMRLEAAWDAESHDGMPTTTAPDGPPTNYEEATGMTAGPAPAETAGGQPEAERGRRFEAYDWAGMLGIEYPPVEMLPGGLLAAGEQAALIGDGKVGKSLFALEMAYRVARGGGWLGDPARAPMRVVYIDLENSPRQFIGRMQAMGFEPCDDLVYLSFPALPPLDVPGGGVALLEAIIQHGGQLVVIDTVSRLISGRENDADTWLAAYRYSWLPLKARGIASLRLDHTGKDAERGGRGSSAKTQDVDHVWAMTQVGGEYLLERTHTRTGEGADRRWVRREGKHDGQRWVGTRHVPGNGPDGRRGGSESSDGWKVQEAIIKAIVDNLGTECSLRKAQDNSPTLALALSVDKLTRQQIREAHALMRLRVEKGQPPTLPTDPPAVTTA